jgi:hypothetical protein
MHVSMICLVKMLQDPRIKEVNLEKNNCIRKEKRLLSDWRLQASTSGHAILPLKSKSDIA